jgi:DNA end-binding protein Ku
MVSYDEIIKGYEYAKDQFVLFTPEEIKAVEESATKAIDIEEFLPLDQVDPVYFDKSYYLGPDKGGERPYKLLASVMGKLKLGGLARYAARGKNYLVFIRPFEDGIIMQQLRFANEVRPFGEVPLGDNVTVKPMELKLAEQLIEQTMADKFRPQNYADDVKGRIQEIIQQKLNGQEIAFVAGESPMAQVVDLMEALKASLEGKVKAKKAGGKKAETAATTRKPAKASPRKAKKTSAKTATTDKKRKTG